MCLKSSSFPNQLEGDNDIYAHTHTHTMCYRRDKVQVCVHFMSFIAYSIYEIRFSFACNEKHLKELVNWRNYLHKWVSVFDYEILYHGADTENQNLEVSCDSVFMTKLGISFSSLLTFWFKDGLQEHELFAVWDFLDHS